MNSNAEHEPDSGVNSQPQRLIVAPTLPYHDSQMMKLALSKEKDIKIRKRISRRSLFPWYP